MQIIFYKGRGTLFDMLIRWITKGPYSHVELVFSDGMMCSSSVRDGGVRFMKADLNPENWTTIQVNATLEEEAVIRRFCEEQVGLDYDILGVLGFVTSFCAEDKQRWFCSELTLTALQEIGLYWWTTPCRVTPNALFNLLL